MENMQLYCLACIETRSGISTIKKVGDVENGLILILSILLTQKVKTGINEIFYKEYTWCTSGIPQGSN